MKKIIFLISSVFILASCEGPQGPQGPAGVDGNANVKAYIYSNLGPNWTTANGEATVSGICNGITSDIMATGAVLAYASFVSPSGDEVQWLLPYTVVEASYQENLRLVHGVGSWILINSASDDFPSIYNSVPKLKVVVISGISGKNSGIEPELSWEDLVKRYPDMEYIYVN